MDYRIRLEESHQSCSAQADKLRDRKRPEIEKVREHSRKLERENEALRQQQKELDAKVYKTCGNS